jgi:hypothetical protein
LRSGCRVRPAYGGGCAWSMPGLQKRRSHGLVCCRHEQKMPDHVRGFIAADSRGQAACCGGVSGRHAVSETDVPAGRSAPSVALARDNYTVPQASAPATGVARRAPGAIAGRAQYLWVVGSVPRAATGAAQDPPASRASATTYSVHDFPSFPLPKSRVSRTSTRDVNPLRPTAAIVPEGRRPRKRKKCARDTL